MLSKTHFSRYLNKNHFVTAAEAADIDDGIKRKRIRVSLKNQDLLTGRDTSILRIIIV